MEPFQPLMDFLNRVPAVSVISAGYFPDGNWWLKLNIDIRHEMAWHVVQGLGHVLNYLSVNETLPTSFFPVSPPPYLNGGPEEFLNWAIESRLDDFSPTAARDWLKSRLPNPVEDAQKWREID
ncbi:MAG: hypothetical protein JJU11_00620 [Candidatus Sumerlaeia bacterium]|nr:hypothetical protein [Candidatus Sumerlaeia bacterium]